MSTIFLIRGFLDTDQKEDGLKHISTAFALIAQPSLEFFAFSKLQIHLPLLLLFPLYLPFFYFLSTFDCGLAGPVVYLSASPFLSSFLLISQYL